MSEKEQWINAIRDNSSETIANIILADDEKIKKQSKEIERLNNIITDLQQENKQLKANWNKLKKRLTTYQILHRDCKVDNLKNISKIEEKETQQKEFIKYLEDEIKLQEEINDIVLATGFEEILQKYRSIIGVDK